MGFAAGADDVVAVGVVAARAAGADRGGARAVPWPASRAAAARAASDPSSSIPRPGWRPSPARRCDLTRIEFDLLGILLEQPTRVVPRDELVSRVWGSWFGDDHVVEVHLSRLRAKVVRAGGPRIGVAVRGVGYRLGLGTPVAV